jgi:hypothetical protein
MVFIVRRLLAILTRLPAAHIEDLPCGTHDLV